MSSKLQVDPPPRLRLMPNCHAVPEKGRGRENQHSHWEHFHRATIEPLSFCAAFVRMTQLSCEGKKTEESKLNKPGVHLHCYVSQTDVDRLHLMTKPVITVCCESLQMSHWGELEHHLKEDKNNLRVKERREKVSYREVEKRRPSQGFFQSECIYWNISFEWFHFFLPIALTPRCSCILKAQRRKNPPHFTAVFND